MGSWEVVDEVGKLLDALDIKKSTGPNSFYFGKLLIRSFAFVLCR